VVVVVVVAVVSVVLVAVSEVVPLGEERRYHAPPIIMIAITMTPSNRPIMIG